VKKNFIAEKGVSISNISPHHYYSPQVLEKELATVFENNWLFVGFTDQLENVNDFLTMQVGQYSIVVQRFKEGLSAFLNVCSHRNAKIQTETSGKRPLVCPYHGWRFKYNGCPLSIPGNKEFFGIDSSNEADFSLTKFNIATCGKFVFIKRSDTPKSLSEQLGSYWDKLEHLSSIMGPVYAEERLFWQTNWKIGVESVMEVYHVQPVHPVSFASMTRKGWDCHYENRNNTGVSYLSCKSDKWWDGIKRKLDLNASELYPDYDHFFIYPNLAIGLTAGSNVSVQTYLPEGVTSCSLHYRLALVKSKSDTKRTKALISAVERSLSDFNSQVLKEDKDISESVQNGFKQISRKTVYGQNEGRIQHFHSSIIDEIPDY
jgi:phenylpropionate dioxygenase-like ring-hydroxylating dioxygenase large terminal subunit